MKLIAKILAYTILVLTLTIQAKAQIKTVGEPYGVTYNTTEYNVSAQNWCAVKDKKGVMYFGNSSGVLIFDGTYWNIVKTKNAAAVKALAIDTATNRVYVGAKSDIGYLETNSSGEYEFKSIIEKIPDGNRYFNDITNIIVDNGEGIIYEARSALYILKNDTITVIPAEGNNSLRAFKTGGKIFVASTKSGIMTLKNGEVRIDKRLADAGYNITSMDLSDNRLLIINKDLGIFEYQNDTLEKIDTPLPDDLRRDIFCATRTHDGQYAFGTISNGAVITDKDLKPIKRLKSSQVSNIYEDDTHLLWISTYTQIISVDLYSPFSWFPHSQTGINGTVRSILRTRNQLYLGANAVFNINIDSLQNPKFRELKNRSGNGAIWKLDTIGGKIIGGGVIGMFSIDTNNTLRTIDEKARLIRNFIIPRRNKNILLADGGSGISIYENKNNKWEYRGSAQGMSAEVRQLGEEPDGTIMASLRNTGVFRISLNENFDTATFKRYTSMNGLPSDIDNYVFDTGNDLKVFTTNGIYQYDKESDSFIEDSATNAHFGGRKTFDLLYNDHRGNLWAKHVVTNKREKQTNIWLLERYKIKKDTFELLSDIFLPFKSHISSFGYIGDGCYIIGDNNGFVHYDENIKKDISKPYNAHIRKVENIYNDSLIYGGNTDLDEIKIVLPYEHHSIRVRFSASFYEHPEDIKFKSFLENNDDEWSDFRSENYKEYPNLRPGKYILHVKAINCYNVESQEARITFEILAPWYLTKWAIMLYVLLFALAIWGLVKAYTKKLIRDKQKLEQIVEERTAEIRKQSQLIMEKNEEITAKNKEITDSIKYAQRIQTAMLPLEEKIKNVLPEHFILFRPKDIVSGDYYWFAETENSIIFTAADCTGHGVPGAFMSMIGSQILTEIVADGITSPDDILTNQNRRIRKALKQDTTDNQDGMDMALCTIDKKTHLVEYSGAKNQLVVIQNDELTEYKADKQSIGGQQLYGDDFQYKKTAIQPDGNTWFYMFSDGYKDQFGGKDNSKFLIKNLRNLFLKIHNEPPEKQREILNDTIEKWIKDGNTEQTDDIIVIGFKC